MRYKLALVYVGLWCVWTNASTLHVEAFGDSLTAGFMAGTQVTDPPPLDEISAIITDFATSFRLKNRSGLAKHHAPNLAWPQQLVNGLKKSGVTDVKLHNYAVSGNRSYDLLGQVKKSSQSGRTIAFFFIGHNDLCDQYPTAEDLGINFRLGMKDALKEWARNHKNAEVFIMPVGKVDEVYAVLKGYHWKKGKTADYTCEQNWERFFPYCRAHYKRYKDGTLDAYLKERIITINDSLDEVASEMQKDDSKNTYTVLSNTHNAAYRKEHFAVDCYHLSGDGQKSLADRVLAETGKFTTF